LWGSIRAPTRPPARWPRRWAPANPHLNQIIHHLVPLLAQPLRPDPHHSNHPWIIDATPIPAHDQPITAISKNCPRSLNTQAVICAQRHRVVAVGRCRPGNRNDVVVARATVAQLRTGERVIGGDGGNPRHPYHHRTRAGPIRADHR
jgi:hypothetical protein